MPFELHIVINARRRIIVLTDQRTWKDANGDGFPQYGEIGPSTISNFGTRAPRFQDPDLVREQQLEVSASVQHQLLPRVSVSAGYYHRMFYDLTKTVNTLVNLATLAGGTVHAVATANGEQVDSLLNPAVSPACCGKACRSGPAGSAFVGSRR